MNQGQADSVLVEIKQIASARKHKVKEINMNGLYNAENHTWKTPLKQSKNFDDGLFFEPDVYVGFQYARGAWIPSAVVGFQLINGDYDGKREVFKLMWEPHFFFSRDAANKLISDRNDFLTFRLYQYDKEENVGLYSPTSFSIGYLINRQGNWYEKHTFKFSVPGLTYKLISLEPEFFFNDFFKHFSPSLKLNFNLD